MFIIVILSGYNKIKAVRDGYILYEAAYNEHLALVKESLKVPTIQEPLRTQGFSFTFIENEEIKKQLENIYLNLLAVE